jgi:hypothetical protein
MMWVGEDENAEKLKQGKIIDEMRWNLGEVNIG